MKNLMASIISVLCFSCSLLGQNVTEQPITKIIVIRHAEKSNDGTQDPPLSPEGINRAERLATYFKDTKIDLLFATPYKRTSQTLSALAATQHLNITTYNPSDNSFFDHFLQNQAGKTAVIAGHSNTAPMIVNGFLKNNKYPQLPESEFGRMWVLTFKGNQLLNCEVVAY